MSDSYRVELDDNLTLSYKVGDSTGTVEVTVEIADTPVHSDTVPAAAKDNQHGNTQRGKYLNDLKEKVAHSDFDAKPGVVKAHVKGWFDDLRDGGTELDGEMRGEIATEIINGTTEPVQIHGAADNNTTFLVELSFRGTTHDIEFAADDLLPGSEPGALQSALMNQYFERVEIPSEDWEAIAEYWHSHSEVASVTETTADGARASRILEFLSDSIEPTTDKEKLDNGKRVALVDKDGEETSEVDDPLVWVQNRHLDDQIASVTSVEQKGNICTELRKADALKLRSRRRWLNTDGRDIFWGFEPDRLGIEPDSFDEIETDGGVEV
jgi:hypothetical protein